MRDPDVPFETSLGHAHEIELNLEALVREFRDLRILLTDFLRDYRKENFDQ